MTRGTGKGKVKRFCDMERHQGTENSLAKFHCRGTRGEQATSKKPSMWVTVSLESSRCEVCLMICSELGICYKTMFFELGKCNVWDAVNHAVKPKRLPFSLSFVMLSDHDYTLQNILYTTEHLSWLQKDFHVHALPHIHPKRHDFYKKH